MKHLLSPDRLFLLAFISMSFGCGGGDPKKAQSQPQPQPEKTGSPEVVEAPHEKCSVIVTGKKLGVTYEILSKSDYKGDIKFNCSYDEKKQPSAQKYFLINGVPSLNIVQLERATKITNDCRLNNSSYTDTVNVAFNYGTGLVTTNIKSTTNGQSSCMSKYKSPLATTISNHNSMSILFNAWAVDVSEANKAKTGLTETDCPQTVVTNNKPKEETPVCKTTINNKYTITDDTGKVHTLEREVSF
jgi:hypothetical protein